MKANQNSSGIIKWGAVVVLLLVVSPWSALAAQPPRTINYQGYLTDSSGTPLNGAYNMVFRIYDAVSAGALEWGPETHNGVVVANGIFQVVLGSAVAMYTNDFDEALFLEIEVNGESMTPRQPFHPVAYAFGLVPGAEIEGDPAAGNYALRVANTGTDTSDRGLYAKGEQYGIYAEEVGEESDIGIYTPDFVHAKGYRSADDSYIWVPGTAALLYPSDGCTLYAQMYGSSRLECSTSGIKWINVPITIPGVLYGQDVRVESIRVFYDLDHAGSHINATWLHKTTHSQRGVKLVDDNTERISTTPAAYTLSTTGESTLGTAAGPLNLFLRIDHDGNMLHDVNIGMIRVRLGHTD
jgi:hypothetical protein